MEIVWRTLLVELHPLNVFGLIADALAVPRGWTPCVEVGLPTYLSELALCYLVRNEAIRKHTHAIISRKSNYSRLKVGP